MSSILKRTKDLYYRNNIAKKLEPNRWNSILVTDEFLPYGLFNSKLKNNKNSISKAKNRCLLTGRARAIINKFKMSRAPLKNNITKGNISGVKKTGW